LPFHIQQLLKPAAGLLYKPAAARVQRVALLTVKQQQQQKLIQVSIPAAAAAAAAGS
jgi:hypothetical protein